MYGGLFQTSTDLKKCDFFLKRQNLTNLLHPLRNIGLESIHRAGFAKAIDVRLLDGYPMRADSRDSSIPFTEESLRRYRAFTS